MAEYLINITPYNKTLECQKEERPNDGIMSDLLTTQYSIKNYENLLLTDANISVKLPFEVIDRYLVSKSKDSYLYKIITNNYIVTKYDIYYAVKNGNLEIVKYLYSKGLTTDESSIYRAANNGHLKELKYLNTVTLDAEDIENDDNITDLAVMDCHLNIVKYLYNERVRGYSKVEATDEGVDMAAVYGHLEIIKYLHDKGLKATENGIIWSSSNRHTEVFEYLKKKATDKKSKVRRKK
jgi:hypothetical protein